MPGIKKMFGSPRQHTGQLQSAEATHVPVNYLAQLKPRNPVVISGDTIAVTLTGGANAPLLFWNGADYYELRTTKTYTWSTSNTILDATSGAVLTAQTSISTGVWYFYIGIIAGDKDTVAAFQLYPSKVPPTPVGAGEYGVGWYIHPGTSKANYWDYVGWCAITTAGDGDTTAVMQAFSKKGYWYEIAGTTVDVNGQSSAAATEDFSARIPVHDCEIAGYLQGGGASTALYASNDSTITTAAAGLLVLSNDDTGAVIVPFQYSGVDTAGYLYTLIDHTADVGYITIDRVRDVV
jgi:hypothetical protein